MNTLIRVIIFLACLALAVLAHAQETVPPADKEAQIHTLMHEALPGQEMDTMEIENVLRAQIHLDRLVARLQQDIDIAKQLQELVDRLRELEPYAYGLHNILQGVDGAGRLNTILRYLSTSETSTRDEPPDTLRLVFAIPGQSAIFEYGDQYYTVAVGGLFDVATMSYKLIALDNHVAELNQDNGDSLHITLASINDY